MFKKIFLMMLTALLPVQGQAAAPEVQAPVILVLGDSLSAAYGLPAEQGWVALLQQRLAAQGYPHRVVNASISGDTTQGGLARLPAALRQFKPEFLLIELGGNDGLRALPVKKLQENLRELIRLGRAAGAKPLIFEMLIPANYGPEYSQQFQQSFSEVARSEKVPLVPFFLRSFAQDPRAFQDDGIHPTAASEPKMLDAAWPEIERLLGRKKKKASKAVATP